MEGTDVRHNHNFFKILSFILGYVFLFAAIMLTMQGINDDTPIYKEALHWTVVELVLLSGLVLVYLFGIRKIIPVAADYKLKYTNKNVVLGIFLIYPFIVFLYANLLHLDFGNIYCPIEKTDWSEVVSDLMFLPVSAIIAPVFEELCCRVMCISVFESKKGKVLALIITTMMFAFCHITDFADKIPGGLLYGILLIMSKNIGIPILLHIAWNLSAFIVPTLSHIVMLFMPEGTKGIFGSPIVAVIILVIAFMVGVSLIFKDYIKYIRDIKGKCYE